MALALPLLVAWTGAAAAALVDGRRRWAGLAALAVLALALAGTIALGVVAIAGDPVETVAGDWPRGVGIALRADALGVVFATLSLTVLLAALGHEVAAGVESRAFPALVLFLGAGLTGLFLTADVFNFYVFFELSMISAYVLASYGAEARHAGAAFVFAVVNLIGTFLFLIGVAGIYHVTGTLEMGAVAERLAAADSSAVILIAVAIFLAFGIKLGLFPFHFWLPAVYSGASPAVAAILSGALANIGSYGLLRFGGELLQAELRLGATVLLVIGTASIIYGSLQAVARRAAPEVLAYSAIGQAGFIIVALAIGGVVGFSAAVLYAVVNSLNKTLLFLAVDLRAALVGGAFAIGALSVAGVPPTAGFLGKAALFEAALEDGGVVVVALIVAGGALSFVYMLQIYQHRYWVEEAEGGVATGLGRAPALAVAGLVLALGLWPEPLLALSREAGEALTGGGA